MIEANWVLSAGFVVLILMGMPFAVALALCMTAALWLLDIEVIVLAQKFIAGTQSFSLLAIPFFILAGDLMTAGGISRRLVKAAQVLVRSYTGGLGMVLVLAAAFFAAISGSAPATTAAIGTIMIPEMVRQGYSKAFATALAVASGIIGPMIPPSIPFVVWGVMSEQSITRLFLAGVFPGLLLTGGLMFVCWVYAKKANIPTEQRASRKEALAAMNDAKWAFLGPVFVLGGIYLGVVTPTEAAVVATMFALLVGAFAYRELSLKTIVTVTEGAIKTSAIVLFIVAAANGFGWVVAFEQLPAKMAAVVSGLSADPLMTILVLNLSLLLIGCVMDNLAAMIILSGFLISIGNQLQMDPIQFGTMVTLNFTVGMATPPFGYTVFVGAAVSGLSIGKIAKPLLPMVGIMVVILLLIALVPPISLYLQDLIM